MLTLIQRVSWNPALKAAVDAAFATGQAEGVFTRHRLPPTGDEQAAVVGDPAAPDGFALFYEARPRCLWLDLIWVSPTHRRQSIGGLMMTAIREHAKAMGYERIELGTSDFDGELSRFYRKRGFEPEHVVMATAIAGGQG
ncbi:GNAT family N-acetyltransferase [Bosea sp. (in: a-proteobacteria)]